MSLNTVIYRRSDLFIVHVKYTLRLSNLKRSIPVSLFRQAYGPTGQILIQVTFAAPNVHVC